MKNWLKSSHGDGVSNAVRGIAVVLAAFILWFVNDQLGLPYEETVSLATEFGGAFGTMWAAYGFVMKAVVGLGSK